MQFEPTHFHINSTDIIPSNNRKAPHNPLLDKKSKFVTMSADKIGIISIGDMGVGIARRLIAEGFKVITTTKGRRFVPFIHEYASYVKKRKLTSPPATYSQDTIDRAVASNIELTASDAEFVAESAVILSIVPPRDAVATTQRVIEATPASRENKPLYLIDLNAVSSTTLKGIAKLVEDSKLPIHFIDGSIIGGPPKLLPVDTSSEAEDKPSWDLPSIPTSGPHEVSSIPDIGPQFEAALGSHHISKEIGAASGLKMCFASLTKGYIAIATQAFTAAHSLGLLDELRAEVSSRQPHLLKAAERGVPNSVPKAYRWVVEMEEIGATFAEAGFDGLMFRGAATVFQDVADDEVLGLEKVGKRKRGTTLEEVAQGLTEGFEKKQRTH